MKKKHPSIRFFFLAVKYILFILVCAYTLFSIYGFRIDIATNTIRETGVIDLNSFPSDVSIFIDGQFASNTVPYANSDVDIGQHTVQITSTSFSSYEKKISVDRQNVVRLGTIFLLPSRPQQYMKKIPFTMQHAFETTHYVVFTNDSQKRIMLYAKNDGSFRWANIQSADTARHVVEKNQKELVFVTSQEAYSLSLDSFRWQQLPLEHPVQKVLVYPNEERIFYTSRGNMYTFDTNQNKNILILPNASDMFLAGENLYFCDSTENNLYHFPVSSWGKISDKVLSTPEKRCPVEKIVSSDNTIIVQSNDGLYVNHIKQSSEINNLIVIGNMILYTKKQELLLYRIEGKKNMLITRFDDTIDTVSPGPDKDHIFVSVSKNIFFCDIRNNVCQKVYEADSPLFFLAYYPQQHTLLISTENDMYTMAFPFWKQ